MTLVTGTARIAAMEPNPGDVGVREALQRMDAWKDAANRLANLHPHEWAELYAAALRERGLTS